MGARLLTIGMLAALAAAPAASQSAPGARALVYIDDVVPADTALAPDAAALTSTLCSALGKDRRLDVMCAPDVRQILSFAATAAMVGTANGPSNAVTERLEKTQLVVSSSLRKEGTGFVLVVKAGHKGADATVEAMEIGRAVVALEQRASASRGLLDALPGVAARVADALLKPAAPGAPPPPPALLDDKARHGG